MKTSISKNLIYNLIKTFSSILFPLITFPYISRVLLTENYGKVSFGSSIISYFALLASLGVNVYAIREVSKVRDNRNEMEKLSSQIFSINIFYTVVAYLILGGCLILADPLEPYRKLIIIQSMSVLFTTLGTDWLNSAVGDFKFITIRTVFFQVLSLLLMFAFVKEPEDYIKFAIISVVASSGANIVNIIYRRKICTIRFTRNIDFKKHFKPILLLFSLQVSQIIYVNSDTTLLGLIRGDFEVGLYGVAVNIYNMINQVIASIAYVVMPSLSMHFEKKEYKELNDILSYSFGYIITLGMPCALGIFLLAPGIILIVSGESFIGAVTALRILMIALVFSMIGGFASNMILLPSGRERICLTASVVSATVNFIANILLIPHGGLNAAAATSALAQGLGMLIVLRCVEKEIKINYKKNLLLSVAMGCISIIAVCSIFEYIIADEIIKTLASIAVCIIIYVCIVLVFKNRFLLEVIKPIISRYGVRR